MSLDQLGRFKITGILGRGAMGTVYRAHDPLLDRTVAIKTVSCAGLSREETAAFEARFYFEAKSAGRLNHPNIVTIHDVGRSDDLAYIAMEFLDGQTLREILDSGTVLPVERSADIAAQIADGLAFAHANGVVHRDIKPANIMVFGSGAVKIADFGVALMPNASLTAAGTAFGSPRYMSPEQVTGQKVDGRSDIFSLGAVFYEMLVGRPPFAGDHLNAVLYQVLNGAPPLPSSFIADLPHGFDRIVARALAKNPDKRYQNAAEMAAALRKYRRVARMLEKQKEAALSQAIPIKPGDATMPVKTLIPAVRRAKKSRGSAWYYGAATFVFTALAAGWFLMHANRPVGPTEAPSVVAKLPEVPAVVPLKEDPVPPVASRDLSVPEVVTPEEVPPPTVVQDLPEARIRLAIAPWGEVYVDGKMAGVTPPLREIRLTAGAHKIEIRNGGFAPHRQTVDLAPDANFRIKHKFQ